MAKTVIEGDLDVVPVREDGTDYPFAMLLAETTVHADTRTELVEELIDGYDKIPAGAEGADEALIARHEFAAETAFLVQQANLGQAQNKGLFDAVSESEETLTVLFAHRAQAVRDVTAWEHEQALILVATDYQPYNQHPAPTGNVKFIDPFTETTLLESLQGLDLLEVLVKVDA